MSREYGTHTLLFAVAGRDFFWFCPASSEPRISGWAHGAACVGAGAGGVRDGAGGTMGGGGRGHHRSGDEGGRSEGGGGES